MAFSIAWAATLVKHAPRGTFNRLRLRRADPNMRTVAPEPLQTLAEWMEQARQEGAPEPEAMALATATADGAPSVRVVLCRGIDERGLSFYTNYESRKGSELAKNPLAAAVFHWPVLGRQVRVEGRADRLSPAESDAYFAARPRGHRLSACASPQSRPVGSLDELRRRAAELETAYEGREVPRPLYWGGFLLRATAVELWIRGPDRMHDRVRFEREERRQTGQNTPHSWTARRLAP